MGSFEDMRQRPSVDADRPGDAGASPRAGSARSAPVRALLVGIGTISLVLGVIGILVPILPTTPFLLLAAACYARASERLYGWLLGQPSLGPIVVEWRRSRSLPPGVKARALLAVVLTFGLSILLVDVLLLRLGLALCGFVVASFLLRIPTAADA